MMQQDNKGNWLPTKVFPCDCGSEGLVVAVEEANDYNECVGAPYINIAFWQFAYDGKLGGGDRLSKWERVKYAFDILRGRSPWTAMVGMNPLIARNFANHIIYLLNKARKSENLPKPLVERLELGPTLPTLSPEESAELDAEEKELGER